MARFKVVSGAARVTVSGTVRFVSQGALLPAGTDRDSVAALLAAGRVVDLDAPVVGADPVAAVPAVVEEEPVSVPEVAPVDGPVDEVEQPEAVKPRSRGKK